MTVECESRFFVGTSGWSYPHWAGCFYPEDWPKSRWFEYYSLCFSTVEINATFYRFFKDSTYLKWRNEAPQGFRYVLKAPRLISHMKCLKDVEEPIKRFCASAELLEDKLGLILLQVSPRMAYNPERLEKALKAFECPEKLAVEFRRLEWLTDEIHDMLKQHRVIFCNAESPLTSLNDWMTSDTVYIRLHGRTEWCSYNYTENDLLEIAKKASSFISQGAKCIYIFFNNDTDGFAPPNAISLINLLRRSTVYNV